jgi:CheY-like chemotaxis protein
VAQTIHHEKGDFAMSRVSPASGRYDVFGACGRLQPGDGVSEARRSGAAVPRASAAARLLRVLVADDNQDAADSLSMLVEMWGYEVRQAYDGMAVLAITSVYEPDVMLLDVAMPKLDGLELARKLRRQSRFKDTLLIAITGYADEAHRLLCVEAGFDQHLGKPVEPLYMEQLLLQQKWLANERAM